MALTIWLSLPLAKSRLCIADYDPMSVIGLPEDVVCFP